MVCFSPPAVGWSPVVTTDAAGWAKLPCTALRRGEVFVDGLVVFVGLLGPSSTFFLSRPETNTEAIAIPVRSAVVIHPALPAEGYAA